MNTPVFFYTKILKYYQRYNIYYILNLLIIVLLIYLNAHAISVSPTVSDSWTKLFAAALFPLLQVELFPVDFENEVWIFPGQSTWMRVSFSSSLISPLVGPSCTAAYWAAFSTTLRLMASTSVVKEMRAKATKARMVFIFYKKYIYQSKF